MNLVTVGRRVVARAPRLIGKLWYTARFWLRNRLGGAPVTGEGQVVVSLTSYGKRARGVYLTIESIASGAVKPARLLLWLDEQPLLDSLPPELVRLQARGLEILSCPNYGPHKKYFPYVLMSEGRGSLPLVTADDDMFYPRSWLKDLVAGHDREPECIIAHRARQISGVRGRHLGLAPYSEWALATSTEPSYSLFTTGAGGALYPVSMLSALFVRGERFLEKCRNADDIWLHATAVDSGVRTCQVRRSAPNFLMRFGSQGDALFLRNHEPSGNDRTIEYAYGQKALKRIREDLQREEG